MVIKGSSIIGLKVLSKQDGKKVEDVDDLIYSSQDHTVKAVLVKAKDMFNDAQVILMQDILSIGKDAVVIQTKNVLKKTSEVDEPVASIAKNNMFLTKTKIITETGTELGTISDLLFDSKTGIVKEFEVSQGGLTNIQSGKKKIKVSDIIKIGKEITFVKGFAEAEVKKQSEQGGVQGMIKKTADTVKKEVPRLIEQVKTKTKEVGEKAKGKTQEIKEDPQVQQEMNKVKEKSAKAINSAQQRVQQAQQEPPQSRQDTKDEYKLPKGTTVKLPTGQEYVTNTDSKIKKTK